MRDPSLPQIIEDYARVDDAGGVDEERDPAEIHPDDMEELRLCAVMIRTWMPASFPSNEHGQKHFVRVVMESVADVIDRVAPPSTPAADVETGA